MLLCNYVKYIESIKVRTKWTKLCEFYTLSSSSKKFMYPYSRCSFILLRLLALSAYLNVNILVLDKRKLTKV